MKSYLKAIKVRLYPSEEQEAYIKCLLGSCRFVYNKLLEYKIQKYNQDKTSVSFGELGKQLTHLKTQKETKWLKDSHSKVLQQTLINLEQAYKSFFMNGTGFPKFKSKKNNKQSCRFPVDAIGSINGNRIDIITKLKDIHFKCSKRDEKHLNQYFENIRSGTLTMNKVGQYYFSILIEIPESTRRTVPQTTNEIGLDLGIKGFIVDSNGAEYENLKIIRKNENKLKKLQRSISKKKIGSKNRDKARIKLARFNLKLSNIKDFYLHQISNKIIEDNQLICIEDLNVKGIMKNHVLAKSIGELSLFRFKEMLGYKSDWYGRTLVEIGRFFPSSKLCNCCGEKNDSLTLSDRIWTCKSCGTLHNRDMNAAINILTEGKRINNIGPSSPEYTLGEIGSYSGRRTKKKMEVAE